MTNKISNSKLIAKNTFILYVRMIIVVVVGLYTSRIVLCALGIEDFGLYNVVAGVVALFTFFRTSMEKCTQRFLNVEMEKNDGHLKEIFSVALIIHIVIALIVLFIAETIGLWFVNTYIKIPEGRCFAANCVYQTVVFGLVFTIISVPYSACVIAYEKMGVFAVIGIIDCVLNLCIAEILLHYEGDALILYGVLVAFVVGFNFFLYAIYCKKNFSEITFVFVKDKCLYKQMLSYTSWTLVGHAMIIGTNQGNVILVNMFHGVTANAAMAVASQVNRHVLNLTNNFQTAFNPQITKAYAISEYEYLKKLVYCTSKISFCLLFVVIFPFVCHINSILDLWLDEVPIYSDIFCVLMLFSGTLQAMSAPLNYAIMAKGDIKWFQIVTGLVFVSDLLVLYILFSLAFPPEAAMWVKLVIMFFVVWVRLYFAQKNIESITFVGYIKEVFIPLMVLFVCIGTSSYYLVNFYGNEYGNILITFFMEIFSIIMIYGIVLNREEKDFVFRYIASKIHKR